MKNELIKHLLRHCQKDILTVLSEKNWEHFRDYFFIQSNYKTNLDDKFKSKFSYFYRLRMGAHQKETFFNLLKSGEGDFLKILKTLYQIDNRGLYLSFASKLLHTTDNSLPIYDNNIAFVLGLPEQNNKGALETKLQNREDIYQSLKNRFGVLLSDGEVQSILSEYRQEIDRQLGAACIKSDGVLLADTKLLDSLVWSLFFVLSRQDA